MQTNKKDSKTINFETDQQVMDRIATRFDILHDMTKAVIAGDVRAMIVTGPPGVGKSYGVEKELDKASMMDSIAGRPIKYEVVKGAMTALGLYAKLYQHADANHVLGGTIGDVIAKMDISKAVSLFQRMPARAAGKILTSLGKVDADFASQISERLTPDKNELLSSKTANQQRFFAEANIALPGLNSDNTSVDDLFEALVVQRGRLKEMQQLREW